MTSQSIGDLLRQWRQRRRFSQLDLAGEANISARHLSFLETGRAQPSREMVLLLAQHLEIPLRSRNVLLDAAGFAPVYPERTLTDPALDAAREAVNAVLMGHEPYPALAMDRHWNMIAHNRAIMPLLIGVNPKLLEPSVNVIRLSLHPDGLSSRIVNFSQWRSHLLERLHRQIEISADAVLQALFEEVLMYSNNPDSSESNDDWKYSGVIVPLKLEGPHGELSFISTTMVFGTPVDITLSELAIESFFPANAKTAEILRQA